ncbi:transcriptional regulator with XRE-family HTH domain [Chitinophaga terrae (ex Kim and Jung 2007)]|uniref:helix-turn-helix domain-containing protein n=1 Tax=Chitinophaga TaxID=79328 RepID=UPI0025BD9065|nr:MULTISPECIES: helix-turn-helix transcriptional regulator [Chitinophaga]MDQ0110510.1 transcriptional regulator with XRE-family HTH domain [Chitinophaga terrae (ex Kim and Jung 2007)]
MGEVTQIEQYVIDRVREKRKEHGITQLELAIALNVSEGFIGSVESRKFDDKYNLRHLNELAKIFNCSPKDFLPIVPL